MAEIPSGNPERKPPKQPAPEQASPKSAGEETPHQAQETKLVESAQALTEEQAKEKVEEVGRAAEIKAKEVAKRAERQYQKPELTEALKQAQEIVAIVKTKPESFPHLAFLKDVPIPFEQALAPTILRLTHPANQARVGTDPNFLLSISRELRKIEEANWSEAVVFIRKINERALEIAEEQVEQKRLTREKAEEIRAQTEALERSPSLGAAAVADQEPEEILFDKSDPRFANLPRNVQRAIRRYHNTLASDPDAIDKHFLEGIRNEIAGSEDIPDDLREEILERLRKKREEIKDREVTEKQVERIRDLKTRGEMENLIDLLSEEARKPAEQRLIRDDILDITQEGIISSEDPDALERALERIEERISSSDLNSQERSFLEQSRRTFERRFKEMERLLRAGRIRSIEYERYGYRDDEIKFIEETLFKPKEALKYIVDNGFDNFKKEVKKTFNKLYSKANRSPRSPFDHSFSAYYDKPVFERFEQALNLIEFHIKEEPEEIPDDLRKRTWEVKEINPLTKELESKEVNISEMLRILREKMMHELDLTEYTHNVYFILLTRGKPENLAGFAARAHAVDLDALFVEEEAIEQAYYFFLGEVRKALTNKFWEIDPTFFAPDPRTFREHFEDKVRQKLIDFYRITDKELAEWERERAISLARGAALGLTGELLDTIAQGDAPKGEAAFRGYFGDVVAPAINPMHHTVFRFHPGKISDLFYALVRRKGTFSGWEWQELQRTKEHLQKNLYVEGLTGTPLIEFINLFGSGSVLARKGWRLTGATKHLLPGLDYERIGEKERYVWANVDVDATWENLTRAGSGIAYEWAVVLSKIKEEDLAKMSSQEAAKARQLKEKIKVENVLEEVKKRNPLKFLYDLDKAKRYDGSLRQKVAQELPQFKNKSFKDIVEQIDSIEDRLLLIQRKAISENRAIREGDFSLLGRLGLPEEEINLVKEYWQTLNRVITIKTKNSAVQVAGKDFQAPAFFFGSEDFHFEDIRFYEGGASLIARLYGDMNALGEASSNYLHNLEPTLLAASRANDTKPLIDLNSATRSVVQGIHGEERAAEISYYIALLNSRFFQKNWRARLPVLIGTTIGTITGQESLSKFVAGRGAWAWDEQNLARYIAEEVEAGNLPTKTRAEKEKIKFSDETPICDVTFKKEVGARNWQVAFDISRTAIPLIIFLMMLQAAKEETRTQ